jgi:ATP-dependent RNA helicase RhlB
VAAKPVVAVAAVAAAKPEGERPPRKRRRRRHGVPVEGVVANAGAPQQQESPSQAAKPVADNSSFLTKLGRKLKSLVSGS